MIVRIDDDVEIKRNSVKTIITTECIIGDSAIEPVSGRILAYFFRDSLSENLRYGDRILMNSYMQRPDSTMNPYAFNYRKYLSQMGIHYTTWIGEGKWKIMERDKGNTLKAFALRLRNNIINILKTQLGEGEEYQVAAAIVAGYRTALESDLRQTFANAGAMHVMCVSGLHVGIIFLILSRLLKFLSDKKTLQRIIKVMVILLVIWLYAMLTGFSASVMRASAMFSFVAAGMLVQRKVPIYNSLAASALFLLIINPLFIYQVGFKLSYLAVIGIVALFPAIQKLFPAKGKFSIKIRDLIAVSIAAQIATAPVSIYYFNQFPNYFILTNIVAVPLAGLIIYTAIPSLIFSGVPIVNQLLSYMLGALMKILNGAVVFIDSLPGAVSNQLFISFFQMMLLYATIALLYHGYINRKHYYYKLTFITLILFFTMNSVHSIRQMHHKEMIYAYRTGDAIAFFSNGEGIILSNDTSETFRKQFTWTMSKYLSTHKISSTRFLSRDSALQTSDFLYTYPVIQYAGKRIVIWDGNWQVSQKDTMLIADYLFLENSPFVRFEELSKSFQNSVFVFTTNNKRNTVQIWEKIIEQNPHFNMYKSGAFRIKAE
jgi:competence protein ComEC